MKIDDLYADGVGLHPALLSLDFLRLPVRDLDHRGGLASPDSILKGGRAERDNYLKLLSAGGSDYPVAILQRAGLDMTKPDPYRDVVRIFGETIDRIEALL